MAHALTDTVEKGAPMFVSINHLFAATLAAVLVAPLAGCQGDSSSVALGVLAKERVSLTATASEIVVERPIAEGSAVKVGDVLIRLDDTLQKAGLALAQAKLAQAQADLDKLVDGARREEIAIAQANVEAAQAAFEEASTVLKRDTVLLERGTITEARFDQVVARRDEAQAQLTRATEQLQQLTSGAREEDVRIFQANVDAARASVASEQRKLDNLTVRSSREGVLDSLPWNLGERVSMGSPVAIVLAGDVPFARVYVPEAARTKLSTGDTISVRVDGVDKALEGHVNWISSDPSFTPYYALNQTERSRLMYVAEIALPEEAADLPVGLPAQAILP